MCRPYFIVLGVALALGCTAGGRTAAPSEDLAPAEGLELVVRNEGTTRASAWVQWEGGTNLVLLGEIRGGATSTFTTRVRGSGVRVTFRRRGNQDDLEYVPVRAGDRLEWTLRRDQSVFYLRLPAN